MQIFLAGALSIIVQVLLLRELSAAFYGVDLVYLLALGAWLLWTAAGALVGRHNLQPSAGRVAGVLIAVGFVVPLEVALARRLRVLLGGVPGAYLPLPTQLAASALCLLPASLLLGVLFQWAAKRYLAAEPSPAEAGSHKRSVARAYAIESAGGVIGGFIATLTLHWRMPNVSLALATAALAFAAALRNPRSRPVATVGLLLLLPATWQAPRIDRWMTSWNHPDVVESIDSPYGRVTVTERAGQVIVYENDALTLDSEATDAEEFAHLALVQHDRPRQVLLVAGAAAGVLPYVTQHLPDRIDDVELDRGVVDLLGRRVPAIRQALLHPTVHLVFDDPRRAIGNCTAGNSGRPGELECGAAYDVILVAAAEPSSAQGNRLFTREFFRLCAARLRPGGLVAFRLASIENLWTPALAARTGSIYAALRAVFSDVVVLPGSTNIVLASTAALARDPQVLAARLDGRAIHARLVSARYVRYLYSNDRFAEIESLLARSHAPANTDANAASYQATAIVWLSKFVPSLAGVNLGRAGEAWRWSSARAWALLALLASLALLWRWRRWRAHYALVAIAAFGGMCLETLLLLEYQLKHGVVFQDLGLLLMSVMAGLAAGAWIVDRANGSARVVCGRLTVGALVTLAIVVSLAIETGYGTGLPAIALMLFLAGAIVAGVFAWASAGAEDQRRLVSPLYAADVLGGCLGAVAASLVMIPLLGLPLTALWTAAIGVVALLLAW